MTCKASFLVRIASSDSSPPIIRERGREKCSGQIRTLETQSALSLSFSLAPDLKRVQTFLISLDPFHPAQLIEEELFLRSSILSRKERKKEMEKSERKSGRSLAHSFVALVGMEIKKQENPISSSSINQQCRVMGEDATG